MKLLVAWAELTNDDLKQIREETGAVVFQAAHKEQALQFIAEIDVIFGSVAREVLERAVKCRWLQIPYAGVERILATKWGNPQMVLTNGRGIFGPPIGEHVVGLLLAFNRGLHLARDWQKKRIWNQDFPYPYRELAGAVVGILGYGDLGQQIAKRLFGFGCRIIGFRQRPSGQEAYAQKVYPSGALDNFLPQLDYLICTLPETEQTKGFLGRERLRLLPEHAILINVGRGSLIPEEDLVLALQNRWIAGAALDVTNPEPLPPESPLWQLENVIITPHNSGFTPFHRKRALQIFLENWRYFRTSGAPRINVVDPQKGY